jgi:hypothetical protein
VTQHTASQVLVRKVDLNTANRIEKVESAQTCKVPAPSSSMLPVTRVSKRTSDLSLRFRSCEKKRPQKIEQLPAEYLSEFVSRLLVHSPMESDQTRRHAVNQSVSYLSTAKQQ